MINYNEAQELSGLMGRVMEDLNPNLPYYKELQRAREITNIIVGDLEDCEFEQLNPHEWHCNTHDVIKIAGTKEPVNCRIWNS